MPDAMGRRTFVTGAAAVALAAGTGSAEAADLVGGNLPDFHQPLKDELNFPLGWGTSPIRDFRAWRHAARAEVEEHLLVDRQDGTPYAPQFTAGPQEDGYTRELVTLSLTRHERVRAALLTPQGPGPFPAVLLLHDHGAKFDIGKEKLVRPWYDDTRLASAQAWADKYFSGRFVGDELARRGSCCAWTRSAGATGARSPTTNSRRWPPTSTPRLLARRTHGPRGRPCRRFRHRRRPSGP